MVKIVVKHAPLLTCSLLIKILLLLLMFTWCNMMLSCYSKCNHGKLNCSSQAGEPKITSSAIPSAKFKLKTLLRYSNIGMTSASFLLLIHVLFWFRLCRSNGLLQLHKSWNKRDRVSEDVWETRPKQLCELERMDENTWIIGWKE